MNVEQYDKIARLQSRVSNLETDIPFSFRFAQNLRRELDLTIDKEMIEFERLGSRVSLLDGGSSSSRDVDKLIGESVRLRTMIELLEG